MAGFSDIQATYPPLDVLKPVAEGVWVVDSGPLELMRIPVPLRMTVVRLGNGDLWLHSPTRFDGELKNALEEHGRIRHLVAPSAAHWMYVAEWQRSCPDALTWAAPGLRDRGPVKKSGVRLDRDLPDVSPEEWAGEIDQVVVPGAGGFREVDFFHHPTRTLVLTDLVLNIEPEKLPPLARPLARIIGVTAPEGRAPIYLRGIVLMKRQQAAAAARRMVELSPERVIFSHGRWFERDGAAALRRSLDWLLPKGG